MKFKNKKTIGKIDSSLILKTSIAFLSVIIVVLFFFLIKELRAITDNNVIRYDNDPRIKFYQSFLPFRKWNIETPTINARGAIVTAISERGKKSLFEKNPNVSLPIASVTKLMTVVVAMEKYALEQQLVVSERAFLKDIFRSNYPGETYKVKDLIYASLIESNNTAAQTLAEGRTMFDYDKTDASFISRMNEKALSLGMNQTHFSNSTGLDPINPSIPINRSSPRDLVIFAEYLVNKPLIWEILSTETYDLRTADGTFKYTMLNTNQLLNKRNDIKGGKTGTTVRAGGNFLAVFERNDTIIVTIILGSPSRFDDTQTMLNWIDDAYYWKSL